MKRPFACCFSLLVFAVAIPVHAADHEKAPEESSEMQSLFNGEDLEGWDGDPQLWSVKDGVIHGQTTAEKPAKGNTFLVSKAGEFDDFELRLSFRCSATNNSGIQYRSRHITEGNVRNPWVVRGYQHEIRNEHNLPNVSGFIYDEGGRRGRICLVGEKAKWTTDGKQVEADDLINEEEFQQLFKLDDWNDVVIVAKGNRIKHYMNGRLILDFTDEAPEQALKKGIIALQLHAGQPMWAEFRDVRIKKYGQADEEKKTPEVGDRAPQFEVKDDSGATWKSSEHFGKKIVVVYFYPADMTGGCTAQACGFRDDMAALSGKDVEVVGVSGDSVRNHQLFKKAHELNFALLADVDGAVADKFGVPKTEGKKTVRATIGGVDYVLPREVTTQRWTFVVDREGKIAYKDSQVNAKQDSQKILEVVESLR